MPAAPRSAEAVAALGEEASRDDPAALATPAGAVVSCREDADARLQRARTIAWRTLNRRDRTVAELRGRLAERGVDPAGADLVVGELVAGGYLDDAAFALRFAEDRRRLDGWGRDRIARRLRELGVAAEHVEAALAARPADEEHAAARALLRRRFPAPPEDRRARDRAIGVLVRRGHPLAVAVAALEAHAAESAAAPGPRTSSEA